MEVVLCVCFGFVEALHSRIGEVFTACNPTCISSICQFLVEVQRLLVDTRQDISFLMFDVPL
jgi:hypothetical protein